MQARKEDDEMEVVWVSLPLDLRTFAWLASLAEQCHALPESVAASILRDVCEDDEVAAISDPERERASLN
jgi:hypothetical protein